MRVRTITLFVAFLYAAPTHAHEIGTTSVDAFFASNQTYRIRIRADAITLLNRLEVQAQRPRSRSLNPREAESRILQLQSELARDCGVVFDGRRVAPRIGVHVGAAAVTIDLEGSIPERAKTFAWSYALTYGSYSLTLHNEGDRQPVRQWLEGDKRSRDFPLRQPSIAATRLRIALQYFSLGFTHIVPRGLDHILFVLGLFLLSVKLKPVLTQVTAFTIAHSITLGLTIYGVVSVSPRIVEPMIALSIAYVAIENLTTSQLRPWRVAIVFAFGLLHGMGFAGVLKELGLPRSEFLTALVTFNVGVEAGQLAVIATAFLLVAWWAHARPWYRSRFVVPASASIAATGIFWTVQRVFV